MSTPVTAVIVDDRLIVRHRRLVEILQSGTTEMARVRENDLVNACIYARREAGLFERSIAGDDLAFAERQYRAGMEMALAMLTTPLQGDL